jgi:tetraacyldisaccharide 4'-kinase
MYVLGLKKPYKSRNHIICVGNLVAGGTGKTPVAIHIVSLLQSLGHEVVIGCSGYGSPHAEAAAVATAGNLEPSEWGDEPAEFRQALPNVPIIVGRRRVLAAQLCEKHFPKAILVMDDGFQHLPLAKQTTILLDDPKPKNPFCIPAGPYREPRSARARASLVLPGVFSISYTKLSFSEHLPPKVNALCAIGQPQKFLESLRECGVDPVIFRDLPDHDPLSDPNLFECDNNYPWLVTAKDAVKLKPINGVKIIVATRTATILPEDDFKKWLINMSVSENLD